MIALDTYYSTRRPPRAAQVPCCHVVRRRDGRQLGNRLPRRQEEGLRPLRVLLRVVRARHGLWIWVGDMRKPRNGAHEPSV